MRCSHSLRTMPLREVAIVSVLNGRRSIIGVERVFGLTNYLQYLLHDLRVKAFARMEWHHHPHIPSHVDAMAS